MLDHLTLCVTGGRNYNDRVIVFDTLDQLTFEYFGNNCQSDQVTLIVGGAKGADSLAELWARTNGYNVRLFTADWNKYGKMAGILRNLDMIDAGFDFLVSFPGGRGTAHMTDTSVKENFTVYKVNEDGTHGKISE